ncbi:MAG: PTS sugar transporter subunit IIB [bacterium]|jgi:mannose/fructose/N-acetylgalactosamine-specific phosphotransferase system component IIB|nr:PTS sugar transporter subunit IIB [bacterium]MBK7188008.1 PTS sugar transporter subunit IIB [bacterium]MBK7771841.1 PTS sugar transporter subunit IIB [bacterium]MBK9473552.1 PTS sugar transporter subunit IIB [bacterium]MBK9775049.1 PTS sugar transporter subunit IIB [bacterium]
MPVILARVDDRLIHGQVTVGWSERLRPDRIVLASNEIAADPWQSRVYASSVPPSIAVSVVSLARAVASLRSPESTGERTIVLTGTPTEMSDLAHLGAPLPGVNLGGMHFATGKIEMLPFVFVDRRDLEAMKRLLAAGLALHAQQVPGGREYSVGAQQLADMEARL